MPHLIDDAPSTVMTEHAAAVQGLGRSELSAFLPPLAQSRLVVISTGMSHLQSQMHAAMEEARHACQKEREASEALRARQHEYETANLRGRQNR